MGGEVAGDRLGCGRVDDQVLGPQPGQLRSVVGPQVAGCDGDVGVRVAAEDPPGDPEDLQIAGVTDVQELPGAGSRVVYVPVDQVQLSYAGARELQCDWAAERPHSDDGDRCRGQPVTVVPGQPRGEIGAAEGPAAAHTDAPAVVDGPGGGVGLGVEQGRAA